MFPVLQSLRTFPLHPSVLRTSGIVGSKAIYLHSHILKPPFLELQGWDQRPILHCYNVQQSNIKVTMFQVWISFHPLIFWVVVIWSFQIFTEILQAFCCFHDQLAISVKEQRPLNSLRILSSLSSCFLHGVIDSGGICVKVWNISSSFDNNQTRQRWPSNKENMGTDDEKNNSQKSYDIVLLMEDA